ncbi:hypothetical protein GGR58DRAFT_496356 [Xylaria digitata]|nr:hypothetical protein GGR58DRAFT_496356 [Xylaria digitata]
MSNILSQVETLHAIANNRSKDRLKQLNESTRCDTPRDVESLTRLLMTECLAVSNPSSLEIRRFALRYILFTVYDMGTMKHSHIKQILSECFLRLDELLFFGLLTRKVDRAALRSKILVDLEVSKIPDRRKYGAFYNIEDSFIYISLKCCKKHKPYPFKDLLLTLCRQMAHAYLQTFTDSKYPDGYSDALYTLLKFIGEQLSKWTEDPGLQEGMFIDERVPSDKIHSKKRYGWKIIQLVFRFISSRRTDTSVRLPPGQTSESG